MDTNEFNRLLKVLHTDGRAIEKIYGYYYPRIIAHIKTKFVTVCAEDIAQEYFVRLMSREDNLGYVKYPTSWIMATCDNIARRKIETESYIGLRDCEYSCDFVETISDVINNVVIADAMKRLDEMSQKIVYYFNWEGYSHIEIAAMFGMTYPVIRQKYHRAMLKIKSYITAGSREDEYID